jgi:hypothetical protein
MPAVDTLLPRSVIDRSSGQVMAVLDPDEDLVHLGMRYRFARIVGEQILLRDIRNIGALRVFGEQVVKWLILARPHVLRDRQPPFLGIGELRVDIEDYAPEWIEAVPNDLADSKFGLSHVRHDSILHFDKVARSGDGFQVPLDRRLLVATVLQPV